MKKSLDFKIVFTAGITQTEFADLIPVNRVTANRWINKNVKPHAMLLKNVVRTLTLLTVAVRKDLLPGSLPPIHRDNMDDRAAYITTQLRKAERLVKKQMQKQPSSKRKSAA